MRGNFLQWVPMLKAASVVVFLALVVGTFGLDERKEAEAYLGKYGYLGRQPLFRDAEPIEEDAFAEALTKFQKFANIPETGTMDKKTLAHMRLPRCGHPDIDDESEEAPENFILTGRRWPHHNLTWRLLSFSKRMPERTQISIFKDAFQMWADVVDLHFTELASHPHVDIKISFASGFHGDAFPFDGPGQVMAHAFKPPRGDAHFDDAERWTPGEEVEGASLFQVATHEIGHLLGLKHSDVITSVMTPYYFGFVKNFNLTGDDIRGIRTLYP